MPEIIILPTSHIAEESIKKVRKVIGKENPDCVAVELDESRFIMMESGESSSIDALRQLGAWSFAVFFLMKQVQKWLGGKAGLLPGSDMLSAVKEAERNNIAIAFIDRDIGITMQRLSQVPWTEKAKFILFLVKGLAIDSLLLKAGFNKDKQVKIDLTKVPPKKIIMEVTEILKKEFPGLYRVLLKERDLYMSRRLAGLSQHYDKIVAVVGAAHAQGMLSALKGSKEL